MVKNNKTKKQTPSEWLWITDPWDTLDHPHDTTLRLAEAAAQAGIKQSWCDVKTIRLETDQVLLDAQPILRIHPSREATSIQLGRARARHPSEFSKIFYRTDPPIDHAYLHPLELLALGTRNAKNCEFINPLSVLFGSNEKMEAAALDRFVPPSIISSQKDRLLHFGQKEGQVVLKPLHQAQSLGVELLNWSTPQAAAAALTKLEKTTHEFTRPVILQKYLKGIRDGEIRLWFLDGKLLASIKKYPLSGDFRVSIDQGSQMGIIELKKADKLRVQLISRHLKKYKIRLAAVDLIDGFVTDFNFTSPGLLPQMERILDKNLAKTIIQALT